MLWKSDVTTDVFPPRGSWSVGDGSRNPSGHVHRQLKNTCAFKLGITSRRLLCFFQQNITSLYFDILIPLAEKKNQWCCFVRYEETLNIDFLHHCMRFSFHVIMVSILKWLFLVLSDRIPGVTTITSGTCLFISRGIPTDFSQMKNKGVVSNYYGTSFC